MAARRSERLGFAVVASVPLLPAEDRADFAETVINVILSLSDTPPSLVDLLSVALDEGVLLAWDLVLSEEVLCKGATSAVVVTPAKAGGGAAVEVAPPD
jgi:hypothetical protein